MGKKFWLVGAMVVAAVVFSGCDDAEFEVEEPDFEIAVDFDVHDMEFDYAGRVEYSSGNTLLINPSFEPCYYNVDCPDWVHVGNGSSDKSGKPLEIYCDYNYSNEPRTGTVSIYVCNFDIYNNSEEKDYYHYSYNEFPTVVTLEIPVYEFEESFTVTQMGRESE